MLLAKYDEVTQAFLLDRLNRTFRDCIQIWRSNRKFDWGDAFSIHDRIKDITELRITIADQVLRLHIALLHIHAEIPGLLSNPISIRILGARRDNHPAAANMYEQKQIELNETTSRPGFDGEEVTRPECLRMCLDRLIPSSFATKRIRSDPVALEDILDGVSCEMDAEFVKFAAKLRVAQTCFVGDTNHQLLDRFSRLWATYFVNGWSSSLPLTVDPSEERSGRDDRDKVFDCRSQWLSQTNKSSAFRWSDNDALVIVFSVHRDRHSGTTARCRVRPIAPIVSARDPFRGGRQNRPSGPRRSSKHRMRPSSRVSGLTVAVPRVCLRDANHRMTLSQLDDHSRRASSLLRGLSCRQLRPDSA